MTSEATPPLERTKNRILEYCRKINLGTGHRPLSFQVQQIALTLDAQEKAVLDSAIQGLVKDGIFRECRGLTGRQLELTDLGETSVHLGA